MNKVFVFFMLLSVNGLAQNAAIKFKEAEYAYSLGQYTTASSLAAEVQSILKRPTPKVESLKALCFYNAQDYVKAKIALVRFFQLIPLQQNNTAYLEMMQLDKTLNDILVKEEKKLKEAEERKRMDKAAEFEKKMENMGKERKSIQKNQRIITDVPTERSKLDVLKDIDGNLYKTVKIGTQIWIAKNLNTSRFSNGEIIPEAKTTEEWKRAGDLKQPAWCYYENNPENENKFGKLYNWYALNDTRGLAPLGYHIPDFDEWLSIGKSNESGGRLKATFIWAAPNKGATNSTGFSALPGGYRNLDGNFYESWEGKWWTNTSFDTDKSARTLVLSSDSEGLWNSYASKSCGLSVRCVKD